MIECFPTGSLATNTYVLFSKGGAAVVIDPALGCEETLSPFLQSNECALQAIWITHSHLDHIAGCFGLVEKSSPSLGIAVHYLDAANVQNPGSDLLSLWMECRPVTPSVLLEDGVRLCCGEMEWRVIHTPGHTPGSVCFYCEEEKTLFSGDTLFRGTCGTYSFPTSDACLMGESLLKLELLPEDTLVLPGHGRRTTIALEKQWMHDLGVKLRL